MSLHHAHAALAPPTSLHSPASLRSSSLNSPTTSTTPKLFCTCLSLHLPPSLPACKTAKNRSWQRKRLQPSTSCRPFGPNRQMSSVTRHTSHHTALLQLAATAKRAMQLTNYWPRWSKLSLQPLPLALSSPHSKASLIIPLPTPPTKQQPDHHAHIHESHVTHMSHMSHRQVLRPAVCLLCP